MAIDRLPNNSQMEELVKQQIIANLANHPLLNTPLRREYAAECIAKRNGKIFATKIWKYSANSTSMGERMLASEGLTCTPSTDTVDGTDDYENASQIFTWMHCNYEYDGKGTKLPTALEGRPNYRTSGANVNVGTLSPTFWWKIVEYDNYQMWYMSDSPNNALGLVPWCDAVTADGEVLPFYVVASYISVTASDNLLRSQPGVPAYNQSYNSQVTDYAKRQDGSVGTNASINGLGMLFLVIKYATKNVQKIFAGCSNFNTQVEIGLAEENTKRVLLKSQNGFNVGDNISVGTNKDRNNDACHSVVNRKTIKSVENVVINGTNYYAFNIDTEESFSTATGNLMSSMPCPSGQTDSVICHKDGSYISNTDAHHSFRIHGIEFLNGQGQVLGNAFVEKKDDYWLLFVAPKGTKTKQNSREGYLLAGKIPYNNGSDTWVGDVTVDVITGALLQVAKGNGDSVGVGDYIWEGGTGLSDGTTRESYTLGFLGNVSQDGFGSLRCRYDLSRVDWDYSSRD